MVKQKQGVIFDNHTTKPESNKEIQKLNSLVITSSKIIYRVKAVFPFNFFTDEIIVDASKVSVVKRIFFWSGNLRSVAYEDIFLIETDYSIIFGTLVIVDRFYQQTPLEINYLWKTDALRARRIIQGMMIAKKENINLEKIPADMLLVKVEELGKARETKN